MIIRLLKKMFHDLQLSPGSRLHFLGDLHEINITFPEILVKSGFPILRPMFFNACLQSLASAAMVPKQKNQFL